MQLGDHAFVLFFVLFDCKLWSALAAMLDDRPTKVRAELDEAARLRREAALCQAPISPLQSSTSA